MINLRAVWEQNITGSGVRVRVNDDGVNIDHAEFVDHYDADASCDIIYPINTGHGTAVASIVLASADNDECSVGIAPDATLSVCNVFINDRSDTFLADKIDMYDISQNSYGTPACRVIKEGRDLIAERELQPCPFSFEDGVIVSPCSICDFSAATPSTECESAISAHCTYYYEQDVTGCLQFLELLLPDGCDYPYLSTADADSLVQGILDGRGGKGIIYVFAAGNAFNTGEDTNLKGFTNSRFVITVGAVGKDGIHSSYSTPGASLFLAGPGGDHENISNHITANFEGGCRDAGVGTSFAAPVVSGVIALVLQVNPNLTWRDVQGILVQTSRHLAPADPNDETKVTNDAGFTHSNLVGFGVPDASAAVEAAKTWELWPAEKMLMGESGVLGLIIVDDPSQTVTTTVNMTPTTAGFITESVEVYISLQHFSRGDLEVILTSPQGTASILHPGQRPENTVLDEDERWKLLTVRSWGESVEGDWTLSIRDISAGDTLECADAPWLFVQAGGGSDLTCEFVIRNYGFCSNGAVDTSDSNLTPGDVDFLLTVEDNGKTLPEACCECGGGIDTSAFEDTLNQWRLVVWGHEIATDQPNQNAVLTPSPTVLSTLTPAPIVEVETTTMSPAPLASPSTSPSGTPTISPGPTVSAAPTASPSISPSGAPTISPGPSVSTRPSTAPSVSSIPSAIPSVSMIPSASMSPSVSMSPSESMIPSESSSPSTTPSDKPSQLPTMLPTMSSQSPTAALTVSPTDVVAKAAEDSGSTRLATRPCFLVMAAAYLFVF